MSPCPPARPGRRRVGGWRAWRGSRRAACRPALAGSWEAAPPAAACAAEHRSALQSWGRGRIVVGASGFRIAPTLARAGRRRGGVGSPPDTVPPPAGRGGSSPGLRADRFPQPSPDRVGEVIQLVLQEADLVPDGFRAGGRREASPERIHLLLPRLRLRLAALGQLVDPPVPFLSRADQAEVREILQRRIERAGTRRLPAVGGFFQPLDHLIAVLGPPRSASNRTKRSAPRSIRSCPRPLLPPWPPRPPW